MLRLLNFKFNNEFLNDYVERNFTNNEIKFNGKIKILNWFKITNKNLIVCCCNNDKYFYFNNYSYTLLLKDDRPYLRDVIDKYKLGGYEYFNNMREISIKSIDNICSYDTIMSDDINNYKELQNVYNDLVVYKTFTPIPPSTSIENPFGDKWFYVLNKINISGCYDIQDVPVVELANNHYFVRDKNIKLFFANEIKNIEHIYRILAFDIEVYHEGIFPKYGENWISHINIAISNEKSFCLIATDHLSKNDLQRLVRNKETAGVQYAKNYNNVINDVMTEKKYEKILNDNYIWKFMKEIHMLYFIKYILEDNSLDFILHYNGNNFDFPYIIERAKKLGLPKNFLKTKHLFGEETLEFETKTVRYFKKSDSSYHVKTEMKTIIIDLINYIRISHNEYDSFSLKNVSQQLFNCKCKIDSVDNHFIVTPIKEKNYDIFYKAIRTSNYCYINNNPYVIIDKHDIISNEVNINNKDEIQYSITNNSSFKIIPYDDKCKLTDTTAIVQISKDVMDIGNKDTYKDYNLNTAIEMAKYCLHDSMLCLYIFDIEAIDFKISAFSNDYYLPQGKNFKYRNSTTCLGSLLYNLLSTNTYIGKKSSIHLVSYSGGMVIDPKKKYSKNFILCFDFQSLYPSIIIYYNISPETIKLIYKTENAIMKKEAMIRLKQEFMYPDFSLIEVDNNDNKWTLIVIDNRIHGIFPHILQEGKKQRSLYKKDMAIAEEHLINDPNNYKYVSEVKLKDSMQYVKKISNNSIYGLVGSDFFPIADKTCAQICTNRSKNALIFIDKIINNSVIRDCKWYPNMTTHIIPNQTMDTYYELENVCFNSTLSIIYGDTDSAMIEVIPDNDNCDEKKNLKNAIDIGNNLFRILNDKILQQKIKFEFENIYYRSIYLAKKKYIYYKINPEHPEKMTLCFKGISIIRRDYSNFHKHYMNRFITDLQRFIETKNKIILEEIDMFIFDTAKSFLVEIFKNINTKNYDIKDFMISRKFNKTIKNDNYIYGKINEYEDNTGENIIDGERYYFVYVTKTPTNYFEWDDSNYKDNVNENIFLVNPSNPVLNKGFRLVFETYIIRILNDIENYLNNKLTINLKKNLNCKVLSSIVLKKYNETHRS